MWERILLEFLGPNNFLFFKQAKVYKENPNKTGLGSAHEENF
jgi:hypothetical protein